MGSGYEDFGKKSATDTSSYTPDQGDRPNRLMGGGGNLSRTGRWFWATGFEGGYLETNMLFGAGASIVSGGDVGAQAWEGTYCARLLTLAGVGQLSFISKNFVASQSPGSWGVECMFAIGSAGDTDFEIGFDNRSYALAKVFTPRIRIRLPSSNVNAKISYVDTSGVYVDFGSLAGLSPNSTVYHYLKVVYNFDTNRYVRAIFDGTSYDLSAAPIPVSGGGISETYQSAVFICTSQKVGVSSSLVDNVILTANEV